MHLAFLLTQPYKLSSLAQDNSTYENISKNPIGNLTLFLLFMFMKTLDTHYRQYFKLTLSQDIEKERNVLSDNLQFPNCYHSRYPEYACPKPCVVDDENHVCTEKIAVNLSPVQIMNKLRSLFQFIHNVTSSINDVTSLEDFLSLYKITENEYHTILKSRMKCAPATVSRETSSDEVSPSPLQIQKKRYERLSAEPKTVLRTEEDEKYTKHIDDLESLENQLKNELKQFTEDRQAFIKQNVDLSFATALQHEIQLKTESIRNRIAKIEEDKRAALIQNANQHIKNAEKDLAELNELNTRLENVEKASKREATIQTLKQLQMNKLSDTEINRWRYLKSKESLIIQEQKNYETRKAEAELKQKQASSALVIQESKKKPALLTLESNSSIMVQESKAAPLTLESNSSIMVQESKAESKPLENVLVLLEEQKEWEYREKFHNYLKRGLELSSTESTIKTNEQIKDKIYRSLITATEEDNENAKNVKKFIRTMPEDNVKILIEKLMECTPEEVKNYIQKLTDERNEWIKNQVPLYISMVNNLREKPTPTKDEFCDKFQLEIEICESLYSSLKKSNTLKLLRSYFLDLRKAYMNQFEPTTRKRQRPNTEYTPTPQGKRRRFNRYNNDVNTDHFLSQFRTSQWEQDNQPRSLNDSIPTVYRY